MTPTTTDSLDEIRRKRRDRIEARQVDLYLTLAIRMAQRLHLCAVVDPMREAQTRLRHEARERLGIEVAPSEPDGP